MNTHTIALIGAGSWGTAVAIHLAKAGNRVLLWDRDAKRVEDMKQHRENARYLPNIPFPDLLKPQASLKICEQQADEIIIAVPSHAFRDILAKLEKPKHGLAWLTKGVDPSTNQLLSELVGEKFGKKFPFAILTGPSFAREVAQGLPTAVTLAGNNEAFQKALQKRLHYDNLRVYLNEDPIGAQLSGAVKNVLAIACGISDGLNYGANARAALITRGLVEMRRLGVALGAQDETFMGLAGMGDLVLTCTDNQSRNRRFGLKLGQGIALTTAEQEIGQVVEGRHNAAQVCAIAAAHHVEMPICEQVSLLLREKISPQQAVHNLMSRNVGFE